MKTQLEPCRECGRMVSKSAKVCPNCGINKPVKCASIIGSIFKIVAIGFVVLMVFGTLIRAFESPEERAAYDAKIQLEKESDAKNDRIRDADLQIRKANERVDAEQELAVMPVISASTIADAYNENTVAADQKFKGKKFKVSGIVADINTDIMGEPYVSLISESNQFIRPQFKFDKSALQQLVVLRKGTTITMLCIGKGDIVKMPISDSCELIENVIEIPSNVRNLMNKEGELDVLCRGGSGDDTQTKRACEKRDAVSNELEKLGWCWGNSHQFGYEMTWQVCRSG